jgi:hypothetical protein
VHHDNSYFSLVNDLNLTEMNRLTEVDNAHKMKLACVMSIRLKLFIELNCVSDVDNRHVAVITMLALPFLSILIVRTTVSISSVY